MPVAVLSVSGKPLMPTNFKRMRQLIKKGKAKIVKHKPMLTIMLNQENEGITQKIEYKCDVGYQHIGISICSEKHEFVSEQRDLLYDEVEKHKSQSKLRRSRRNRLRYRESRFDNRKKEQGWLAPSIKNKMDQHVMLFNSFKEVLPITKSIFEVGQFDTQLLAAIEKGETISGIDYQRGERYQTSTLREAVFIRDNYTCQCCGRTIKDNAILHVHHIGFWKKDRTNRLNNLMTVCDKCHTPKNHQPNGKLYGLEPKLKTFKGASFMTTIKWQLYERLINENGNISFTYGAMTKLKRNELHLPKSHANDAFAMGNLHPKHRTKTKTFRKQRRNDRVLEKFYDAKWLDSRDMKIKHGKEMTNGRISRSHKKDSENERIYHLKKISKGRRSIRRGRTQIKPNTVVKFNDELLKVKALHNGKNVEFMQPSKDGKKSASINKIKIIKEVFIGGWVQIL